MGRSILTDVVVHLDESLNEETLLNLEQGLRRDEGVVAVGHRPDRSHLMMVVYDSEVSRANVILGSLRAQGLHAQVIG